MEGPRKVQISKKFQAYDPFIKHVLKSRQANGREAGKGMLLRKSLSFHDVKTERCVSLSLPLSLLLMS